MALQYGVQDNKELGSPQTIMKMMMEMKEETDMEETSGNKNSIPSARVDAEELSMERSVVTAITANTSSL